MGNEFQYGILAPVVGLFANEIWKPVKGHFGYCLKPGRKVRELGTATHTVKENLDNIDEQIQLGKRPRDQTRIWIESATSARDESSTISNAYRGRGKHLFGWSWNCFFNYRIGRAASKLKEKKIDDLVKTMPQNDGMFTLLPPVGRELPLPPNIVGQSKYMDEIVACIKQGTQSFIGIYAMGGAGKTTLLKQLNNIFSCTAETQEFNHVIYVEIGQQPNLGTVQQSIASQLGLTLGNDESMTAKSASLHNFLKENNFLLFLDDLWQPVELSKVGIPQGYRQIGPQNRQVIVITTRDQQICRRMEAHGEVIKLQKLEAEEAWSLFESNANCNRLTNSSVTIRDHAQSIVKECGGLPLALKIVGQSMASKECEHDWKHAAVLLQQAQFQKIPDADAESDLFQVLYISYDQLSDQRIKQCFILFALSDYGFHYVPYTIKLWLGHGLLLDEDDDISNGYSTGHSVVGRLKRACLLEEHPRGPNYLRMHDTVRGLALWIVKSKQGDGPNKNWLVRRKQQTVKAEEWSTAHRISLINMRDAVIPDSSCPWLSTLIMVGSRIIGKVPTGFCRTASSLTYLDLQRTNIQELPSHVGGLVNLQHLDLSETPIQSIPSEFRELKSLRYLYLARTRHLKTIPDGTISALSMLRVVNLYKSGPFRKDKTQVYIKELESLPLLESLGFTVSDSDSLQRIMYPSKACLRFCLRFLNIESMEGLQDLYINISGETRAHQLEMLTLQGMQSLKELSVGGESVHSDCHFGSLDELTLIDLKNLESIIWRGVVPHVCLPVLRLLLIDECHGIRAITWIKHLPCLEEVYLFNCHSMLQLVADGGGEIVSSVGDSFPRLKWLGLGHLGSLQNICDGTLAFPCLERLLVYKCPLLAKLPSVLLKPEHAPLILCEQHWWEKLSWDDGSMKSALFPFMRDLPASFGGDLQSIYRALCYY